MNHAQALKGYICRLSLADVDAIAAAYRACWREQNSGNAGSQDRANKELEQTISAALARSLPSDLSTLESIIKKAIQ